MIILLGPWLGLIPGAQGSPCVQPLLWGEDLLSGAALDAGSKCDLIWSLLENHLPSVLFCLLKMELQTGNMHCRNPPTGALRRPTTFAASLWELETHRPVRLRADSWGPLLHVQAVAAALGTSFPSCSSPCSQEFWGPRTSLSSCLLMISAGLISPNTPATRILPGPPPVSPSALNHPWRAFFTPSPLLCAIYASPALMNNFSKVQFRAHLLYNLASISFCLRKFLSVHLLFTHRKPVRYTQELKLMII